MNDRIELLAALVAAGLIFAGIVAPEPMLVIALGALGLGLVARLAEPRHGSVQEAQNRR
jgi:hypothetical protein